MVTWMSDGGLILRLHSDEGGEFWNKLMEIITDRLTIMQTRTEGFDPDANGKAERYVGLMKHLATELMLKTNMPVEAWLWAMKNVAHTYRCEKLDIQLPAPLPQFGEGVLVRRSNI